MPNVPLLIFGLQLEKMICMYIYIYIDRGALIIRVLQGSWGLVAGVVNEVTILRITYSRNSSTSIRTY